MFLAPGTSASVTFDLPGRALAYFDTATGQWRIDGGAFDVHVGFSAANLPLSGRITLAAAQYPVSS